MLDQDSVLPPDVAEAIVLVKGLENNLPANFTALRNEVHSLKLPVGLRIYGPVLYPHGAQIEIVDGFMRPLHIVTFAVPESWHLSGW